MIMTPINKDDQLIVWLKNSLHQSDDQSVKPPKKKTPERNIFLHSGMTDSWPTDRRRKGGKNG